MVFKGAKHFIFSFIIYLFFAHYGHAQQPSFQGLLVDTIKITSSSGHYHFDNAGTTTGTKDRYTIAFDGRSEYITTYNRTHIKYTYTPETEEEKQENTLIGKFDHRKDLDSLLGSLSIKYKITSADEFGVNAQNIKGMVTKKQILRVAKNNSRYWKLTKKYSTRNERDLVFQDCQDINNFKQFLDSFKVDTSGYVMVTDYWDEMHIRIICGDRTFIYEGKYPNKLKQPWYDLSDTTVIARHIFNFGVNKYLNRILPSNFYRKETIETNAVIKTYITWYLGKRGFIPEFWH